MAILLPKTLFSAFSPRLISASIDRLRAGFTVFSCKQMRSHKQCSNAHRLHPMLPGPNSSMKRALHTVQASIVSCTSAYLHCR